MHRNSSLARSESDLAPSASDMIQKYMGKVPDQ
jgi:hypothetical protein